jgi:hypothetical protein
MLNASYPFSDAVEWYVAGCHDSQRPSFLSGTVQATGLAAVAGKETVSKFIANAHSFCDGSGPSIYNSMLAVSNGLSDLLDASGGVYLTLSQCETLNTYYSTLAYDGKRRSSEKIRFASLWCYLTYRAKTRAMRACELPLKSSSTSSW